MSDAEEIDEEREEFVCRAIIACVWRRKGTAGSTRWQTTLKDNIFGLFGIRNAYLLSFRFWLGIW